MSVDDGTGRREIIALKCLECRLISTAVAFHALRAGKVEKFSSYLMLEVSSGDVVIASLPSAFLIIAHSIVSRVGVELSEESH